MAFALPLTGLFDATVKLKVYERGVSGAGDRLIGFTPEHLKKGLRVPSQRLWYVKPMGGYKDAQWTALATNLAKRSVPGLDLANRWDGDDRALESLGRLPALRLLQLDHTRVTDAGLGKLGAFAHLEILSVSPKTSDAGLRALAGAGLDRLRDLDLRGSHVTEAGLNHLAAFPHLAVLALNQAMTDTAAAVLSTLTSLRDLDISLTAVGDSGIDTLTALPIESLYASPRLTDIGLAHLATWTHLRRLDLSRTQISDAGLSALSNLPHLEDLALTDTAITDAGLSEISHIASLKTLELSGTQMTVGGFDFLARLQRLETLSLSMSQLTSDQTAVLARLPHLKTLILDGVPVPETLLASLRGGKKSTFAAAPPAVLTTIHQTPAVETAQRKPTPAAPAPLLANAKRFPGSERKLSGLRNIQRIETEASEISDVFTSSQRQTADENQPKRFLGDIDVRVKP